MQDADAAVIAFLAHLDEFVRGSVEPGRHHPPIAVPHGAEAIPHQCIAPHRPVLDQVADGALVLDFGDVPHAVLATVSRQLHGTAGCGLADPQATRKRSGNASVAPHALARGEVAELRADLAASGATGKADRIARQPRETVFSPRGGTAI